MLSSIIQTRLSRQQQTAVKFWNCTYLDLFSPQASPHSPSLTMPEEDLRKSLAKAKVEAEMSRQRLVEKRQRHDAYDRAKSLENWKNWDAALEAHANGWRPPEPRFYVVVSPRSPVSTPEKLQEVAKMTTAPKLFDTTYTGSGGRKPNAAQLQEDGSPQKVRVGEVSWEELLEVQRQTEFTKFLRVWINGEVRGATMVKWFKTNKHEGGQDMGARIGKGSSGAIPCEEQTRAKFWEGWD